MEDLIKERAKAITRELGIIWLRFNGNMERLLQELSPILARDELNIKLLMEKFSDFEADRSGDMNEYVALAERFRSLEDIVGKLSKELTALKESIATKQDPRSYNSEPQPEPKPEQTKPKHLTLPGDTK